MSKNTLTKDLTEDKTKFFTFETLKDLPNTTGVYCILNKINSKFYIGSAAGTGGKRTHMGGLEHRLRAHKWRLLNNKHHSAYLQRSFNKHGLKNFIIYVIHECPPEECLVYEQIYIDLLCPHFNICKIAGNSLGYRHDKETIERMQDLHAEEFTLVSPQGEIVNGKNLAKFARDLGVDKATLRSVYINKIEHYKGWTSSTEKHNNWKKAYILRGITLSKNRKAYIVKHDFTYDSLEKAFEARDKVEEKRKKKFTVKVRARTLTVEIEDYIKNLVISV
jgi:group I intron endonuclease